MCLPESLRRPVPSYEDVRQRALRVFVEPVAVPRGIRRQGRERYRVFRYMLKCERVFQVIASELGRVARLPRLEEVPPFYAELISISCGDDYNRLVEGCRRAVKVVSRLWREYRSRILSSYTGREAKDLAREFVGRALSAAKRALRPAERVNKALAELRRAPCIESGVPTVIIAGMPQVGKSTLVSVLSSAKPEVAPYPFTTKTVILGHMQLGLYRVQIVDTPGILDRPIEEMNPIERKAVAALTKLERALVLFLMDPSRDSYYPFSRQVETLKSVRSLVGDERLVVVFNKVDKVDRSRLEECRSIVEKLGLRVEAEISALYGIGVDELVDRIAKKLGIPYSSRIS